jgi:nucleoside-diphosphate-sugar epimerase
MKLLVTGSAGFISSAIAHACVKRGWETTGVDNLMTSSESAVPEGRDARKTGYLRDPDAVSQALRGNRRRLPTGGHQKPSPIGGSPKLTLDCNVGGTLNGPRPRERGAAWSPRAQALTATPTERSTERTCPLTRNHRMRQASLRATTTVGSGRAWIKPIHKPKRMGDVGYSEAGSITRAMEELELKPETDCIESIDPTIKWFVNDLRQ